MDFFKQTPNPYMLHDTVVTQVTVMNDGITFTFADGVYVADTDGTCTHKASACNMHLIIRDFEPDCVYQHVDIRTVHKRKIKDMTFSQFSDLVHKCGFRIYLDYYSFFAKSVLLTGTTGNGEAEVTVTEIDRIEFSF